MSNWGSLHTHSQFSVLDGMVPVPDLVAKAAREKHPFIGLTDHGNMAGTVQLYKAAKAHGILPFPGTEAYLADPSADDPTDAKTRRFHIGILARDLTGYKALVKFSSLSHTRPRFNRFPRLLFSDLAEMGTEFGEHLIVLTGCHFGLVQQRLHDEGYKEALRVVETYASWFPHTFVEIQNHGIVHPDGRSEEEVNKLLIEIADEVGLPVIATADAHYLDQRQKKAHALMKRMVYGGPEDEFPGDSFHLPSAEWMREHFDADTWDRVEEACYEVIKLHELSIPVLDNYKAYVPEISKTPNEKLADLAQKGLKRILVDIPKRKHATYTERLKEEISVIRDLGYANYFLLVRKFVRWCKKQGICVEARGSANGSLLCYVLGITQTDPIKWELLFERFLSRDRIKPPDIDLDIEDARRGEALQWLSDNFPDAVQIGTWSELGLSKDNTGEETGRGSVFVSYQAYLRRRSEEMAAEYAIGKGWTKKEIQDYAKRIYGKRFSHIRDIADVKQVSLQDYKALKELADMKSVYRSYGVHAAGVLLGTEEHPIEEWVPTMLVASSNTRVTQYDMDDVEELGFLKVDVLGQATLTVMRMTQQLAGMEDPTDFSWIPDDDQKACRILREGRTNNGIFHFEGYTKAKGGREMGIRSTKDAIFASALYMPGAMDSGQKDHYLYYRRHRDERPEYLHPIFEKVLSPTYGAVVFQEQPIAILRELGMSIKNINVMFKVVKDSGKGALERNAARLAELRKEFDSLCAKHGIEDTDEAWHQVTGFIAYGFNKAHAAGYGIRSYRCAYLKAHTPIEFMTSLLAVWADKGNKEKEKLYVREARRLGIRILPPHVNISGRTWTPDPRGGIRRGLVSISGIGAAAADEIVSKAPYESIMDLVDRCSGRAVSGGKEFRESGKLTGKLLALYEAGALDGLSKQ